MLFLYPGYWMLCHLELGVFRGDVKKMVCISGQQRGTGAERRAEGWCLGKHRQVYFFLSIVSWYQVELNDTWLQEGLENTVWPLTLHEEKNGGTSEQRTVCHTTPTPISNPGNETVPRGPEEIECASGAGMEEGRARQSRYPSPGSRGLFPPLQTICRVIQGLENLQGSALQCWSLTSKACALKPSP